VSLQRNKAGIFRGSEPGANPAGEACHLAVVGEAAAGGAPAASEPVRMFEFVPRAACREDASVRFGQFKGGTTMANDLRSGCDAILQRVTTGKDRAPGVVAMITDGAANIYEGATGERMLGSGQPMTTDTVFALFSTTKAVTGTAILQCVEEGKLDLDTPARTYVPDIGKLEVLSGFDAAGKPQLRAPMRDITTRMLMLHTAGLGYEFFNTNYLRLTQEHGQQSVITCSKVSLMTPLLFDPGDKWEYGSNIDWCGQIVESIRGRRLGEVMKERIFSPLGMEDIGFSLTPSMRQRLAVIHQRGADGSLTPLPDLQLPPDPEVDMGGHGLYGSIGEYMKFIRMWLNDGAGPHGRVLRNETVEAAVRNGLRADQAVVMLPGVIATLSNDAEFFPGLKKSWSYTFMVNDEQAPTGRPAGALGWAGLANTFYWIDRKNGFGGYWASQILPFGDPISFGGYLDFETAAYATRQARAAA
jgi:methyl acetate hydrolase